MGVLEPIEHGPSVHKHAVEFPLPNGQVRRAKFAYLKGGQRPLGFNLNRAKADAVLLGCAEQVGTCVLHGADVDEPLFDGERVAGVRYMCQGQTREARAHFVIDASGRAGVVSRHVGARRMNPRLRNVAVYQYFSDLIPENNTSVEGDQVVDSHPEGWIWCIPVERDLLSVGAVMAAGVLKVRDARATFYEHTSRAPRIWQRMQGATPVFEKVKVESDYCYHTETLAGPGSFIVGDAGCFVDPLFSGGYYLAVAGAFKAAEAISRVLGGDDEDAARTVFSNFLKTGYDTYFRLAYAFYEGCEGDIGRIFTYFPMFLPFGFEVLCGDFWGQPGHPTLKFLRTKREWDTFEEPFEIVYGCPFYAGTTPTPEQSLADAAS